MTNAELNKSLLEPFLAAPARSAILTDLDGTLAPIALRPEDATVSTVVSEAISTLTARFGLVACVTGRRALDARAMVGVDDVIYVGNQGFEHLEPGDAAPTSTPAAAPRRELAGEFLDRIDPKWLDGSGLRSEDKGPLQALHWREAPDQKSAEAAAEKVARLAEHSGLIALWGRKIVELRPVAGIDKGTAVQALLLNRAPMAAALYIGDDRTDLDAFRALRALAATSRLGRALLIGVASSEGPNAIVADADIVVEGTDGVLGILKDLAG